MKQHKWHKEIKITERGWVGHFICGHECRFRRNTLIEYGSERIIVSSVGNLYSNGKLTTVGYDRYSETMAFKAKKDGIYWEIDVTNQVNFDSEWSSNIIDDDTKLDEMHQNVVTEICDKLQKGNIKYETT